MGVVWTCVVVKFHITLPVAAFRQRVSFVDPDSTSSLPSPAKSTAVRQPENWPLTVYLHTKAGVGDAFSDVGVLEALTCMFDGVVAVC